MGMTLKLVHDDSADVVEIGIYNPRLIPDIARTFADKLEAGKFGAVTRVITIVETDEGLARIYWGEGIRHAEAVGLLHMALADATDAARAEYGNE